MCTYKQTIRRNCEWLIKSVIVSLIVAATWITVANLELIHAKGPVRGVVIRYTQADAARRRAEASG